MTRDRTGGHDRRNVVGAAAGHGGIDEATTASSGAGRRTEDLTDRVVAERTVQAVGAEQEAVAVYQRELETSPSTPGLPPRTLVRTWRSLWVRPSSAGISPRRTNLGDVWSRVCCSNLPSRNR